MGAIKCKNCGGQLEIEPNYKIGTCLYCGFRQTIPNDNREKIANMFNRANDLRLQAVFDDAAGIYTSITAEYPEEAEGYWGLCLCKYGIEYVEDPWTGKKIPTCHRTLFESILEDQNFINACKYAEENARQLYEEEAAAIDRIQKDILEIVRTEEPYDVFICYKETDAGNRTEDSVLGEEIYEALTEKGLKTFFSRISLEDKLGQQYEPYIYAALQSSKVMIAISTRPEHYQAVWVKNEWSRFLDMMRRDRTKTLVPCYKYMDAYSLPKEYKFLQGLDMGKIGWKQDLVRGIMKICGEREREEAQADYEAPLPDEHRVHDSSPAATTGVVRRSGRRVVVKDTENARHTVQKMQNHLPVGDERALERSGFACRLLPNHTVEITGLKWENRDTRIQIPGDIGGFPVKRIGKEAFRGRDYITEFQLPDGLERIGECAFLGCVSVVEMRVPDSVTVIEKHAFAYCDNLSRVILPSRLNRLEAYVFYKDHSLSEIRIPSTVERIGVSAFAGCRSLKSIALPAGLKKLDGFAFEGCSSIHEVRIPNGIKTIIYASFRECYALESIIIPDSVEKIEDSAFENCTGLQSVSIPANVSLIEKHAFWKCTRLQNVSFQGAAPVIQQYAFFGSPYDRRIHPELYRE